MPSASEKRRTAGRLRSVGRRASSARRRQEGQASPNLNRGYLSLINLFPLRPIRSDSHLNRAVRVIDSLLSRPRLTREEKDYLEVLSHLVERYEEETHPIPPASDAEMLQHLIEARCISQSEVARETGIADSTISEVLNGKRALNRNHIGRLARYFRVSPNVFPY